jgi:diguanylate cyclase (GGDEF)-like protein
LLTTEETSSSIAASVKLPRTILLVCDIYGSFQHTFAAALRDAVEPQGYGVLCVTGRALERDAAVDDFAHLYALGASMDVAGVVIMASTLGRILQENQLERFVDRYAHLPAVTVGGRTNLCSSVTGDNTRSMRELARHITEDAHRQQILFLRGHESCPNSRQREAAFREVLSERGIAIDESLFLSCGYSASQAERAVGQLLAQGVAIDAIVAANDAMAFGAEIALERQCLAIPRDVVVSGFDDLELAVNATVALTTVRMFPKEQMRQAAQLLFEQMAPATSPGTPPETPHRHITVPGELVIRESSSSLKPLCPVNPVPKNVQAEFAKMGRWHEIVETTHVKLSRWVDRESVFSVFKEAMAALSVSRAFVVSFDNHSHNDDVNLAHAKGTARLVCAYPSTQDFKSPPTFRARSLLPASYRQELAAGLLVASAVVVDDRLVGVLLFDPAGSGRLSMDGIAQSIFAALRHCEQRDFLKTQAHKLEVANKELERIACHDPLTGLANRVRLWADLGTAILADNSGMVVLYMDLDGFKLINDTLGHDAGDKLLSIVATRIQASVRDEDVIARLGGDEFAVLLKNIDDARDAQSIADQLLNEIARPMRLSRQQTITLSASIGLACYPEDGADAETLLKQADTAMYKAKADGRNRSVWFSAELNRDAARRSNLDQGMRDGLLRGEFRLDYQPSFDLRTYSLMGVEALLRWTTQDGDDISPEEFIPIAEQTGVLRMLDAFVLDTACEQIAQWKSRGVACRMAINVSVSRLQQPDIVDEVAATLARHDVRNSNIEFEIAESAELLNVSNIMEKLEAFRSMGISLTVDDFGTAFSSLNYLKSLPITGLKVDRTFITSIQNVEDEMSPDARVIRAIVALGRSLGIQTIAEGVETQLQLNFLRRLGCDEAQGFLFGKPTEASIIESMLRERQFGRAGA